MVAGVALIAGSASLVLIWYYSIPTVILPAIVTPREREFALRSFKSQYGRAAKQSDLLFWLAEWYLARQRPEDAVMCFAEIPTADLEYGRRSRFQQGQALLALHRAIASEQQFRELIPLEETDPTLESRFLVSARQQLRHILEVELRFEERHSLLQRAIERGEANGFETMAGLFPSHLRWSDLAVLELLEEFHAAEPSQPVLRIALGRFFTVEGKLTEARQLLEGVVQERPGDLHAVAALIGCLREADASDKLDRHMDALPAQSADDPWLLLLERGAYALQHNHPQMAVAAYESLLQRDRTCTQAWLGLAQATRWSNDSSRHVRAVKMASGLGRIQNYVSKGLQQVSNPASFLDVADLCAEIDLNREGLILSEFAHKVAPRNERALASIKRFQARLSAGK